MEGVSLTIDAEPVSLLVCDANRVALVAMETGCGDMCRDKLEAVTAVNLLKATSSSCLHLIPSHEPPTSLDLFISFYFLVGFQILQR